MLRVAEVVDAVGAAHVGVTERVVEEDAVDDQALASVGPLDLCGGEVLGEFGGVVEADAALPLLGVGVPPSDQESRARVS